MSVLRAGRGAQGRRAPPVEAEEGDAMQPTQLLELMLHPSAESQPEPRTGANLLIERRE